MKVKTELFYEDWCENKEERCYYHDQSSFNQTKICNDKVLTVPGLVIYDEKRLDSTVQLAKLNMPSKNPKTQSLLMVLDSTTHSE
jgi:hypothetical protein